MFWSAETPFARALVLALTGSLILCAGCGGGGATVPTVTFHPEAVDELTAAKPVADESAAPAAEDENK